MLFPVYPNNLVHQSFSSLEDSLIPRLNSIKIEFYFLFHIEKEKCTIYTSLKVERQNKQEDLYILRKIEKSGRNSSFFSFCVYLGEKKLSLDFSELRFKNARKMDSLPAEILFSILQYAWNSENHAHLVRVCRFFRQILGDVLFLNSSMVWKIQYLPCYSVFLRFKDLNMDRFYHIRIFMATSEEIKKKCPSVKNPLRINEKPLKLYQIAFYTIEGESNNQNQKNLFKNITPKTKYPNWFLLHQTRDNWYLMKKLIFEVEDFKTCPLELKPKIAEMALDMLENVSDTYSFQYSKHHVMKWIPDLFSYTSLQRYTVIVITYELYHEYLGQLLDEHHYKVDVAPIIFRGKNQDGKRCRCRAILSYYLKYPNHIKTDLDLWTENLNKSQWKILVLNISSMIKHDRTVFEKLTPFYKGLVPNILRYIKACVKGGQAASDREDTSSPEKWELFLKIIKTGVRLPSLKELKGNLKTTCNHCHRSLVMEYTQEMQRRNNRFD